jgi:hypothetical protein
MPQPRPSHQTFFRFRKLPARYATLVTPLLLSLLMTCVVSLVSTLVNMGLIPEFLNIWLHAWIVSWLVAFPTLALALPLVRKATSSIVHTA